MGDARRIPQPYHGTAQPVRDMLAEIAWGAGIHCEVAQRYAELGNDAGLRYAVQCLVACAQAAQGCLEQLDKAQGRTSLR